MRTIKFRAWDGKKMIHYTLDDLLWVLYGVGTAGHSLNKAHLRELSNAWHGDNSERMKQQFTGLLDKNGKEIYEGDILKGNILEPNQIEVVQWNDSAAGFDPFGFNEGYEFDESYSVVIGNIHENPDLLKASEFLSEEKK